MNLLGRHIGDEKEEKKPGNIIDDIKEWGKQKLQEKLKEFEGKIVEELKKHLTEFEKFEGKLDDAIKKLEEKVANEKDVHKKNIYLNDALTINYYKMDLLGSDNGDEKEEKKNGNIIDDIKEWGKEKLQEKLKEFEGKI